jgi:hypothetical protein
VGDNVDRVFVVVDKEQPLDLGQIGALTMEFQSWREIPVSKRMALQKKRALAEDLAKNGDIIIFACNMPDLFEMCVEAVQRLRSWASGYDSGVRVLKFYYNSVNGWDLM